MLLLFHYHDLCCFYFGGYGCFRKEWKPLNTAFSNSHHKNTGVRDVTHSLYLHVYTFSYRGWPKVA